MELFDDEKRDSLEFLKLVNLRKGWILTIFILAIGSALAITFFLPKKYLSYGNIIPSALSKTEDLSLSPKAGMQLDADRLVEVLSSQRMRDTLINHLNLAEKFEMDTSEEGWRDKLNLKIIKTLQFERTRNLSIAITATTGNPEFSAQLVNTAIDNVDKIRAAMARQQLQASVNSHEKIYLQKEEELFNILDSISYYQHTGSGEILNKIQTEVNEIRTKREATRKALSDYRNSYGFFDLNKHLDLLQEKHEEANLAWLKENATYELLSGKLSPNDTAVLFSEARRNAADQQRKDLEKRLQALKGIQKDYQALAQQHQLETELLNSASKRYEELMQSTNPEMSSMAYKVWLDKYENEKARLNHLKMNWEKAAAFYEIPLPSTFVLDRAQASTLPVAPSYVQNALLGALLALIISLASLTIEQRFRKLKSVQPSE